MKTYSGLIETLEEGQIFVFGSNPLGYNGNPDRGTGGAALFALKNGWVKQGEKLDNCISKCGKAWGLTTVSAPGKKRSKTPEQIVKGIIKLFDYAETHKENEFLIAYTGNGYNINGYSNRELADMFSYLGYIPENVIFEEVFATMLDLKRADPFTEFKKY